MSSEPIVIKVGGGNAINLLGIARELKTIGPAVVVHGANAARDALAKRLGTPPQRVTSASGVESVLTDTDQLELLTMAYAGLVNKRFVQMCQQEGVNAVGLSGLDGALVTGRRNPGIRVIDNGRKRLLHDLSGKPVDVNTGLVRLLLSEGYTPLITVPILDERGQAINTENDSVVSLLQARLGAKCVVQLLEAKGFLADKDDPESLLPILSFDELDRRTETESGRFRRKLMALSALRATGCEVIYLSDGRIRRTLERSAFRGGDHHSMTSSESVSYELDVMGSRGITLVRGRGARVWDDAGREYIDCVSSNGAAVLGHAHPQVTEALTRQAVELTTVSGAFSHPEKSRLAERLVALAPPGLERAWFCNSGTESIEAALKLARAVTGRSRVVAAKRGFHGRTFGSMSASFHPKLHALFAPVVPGFEFIAYNKIEGLTDALDEEVAALVVELVQGEGGVYPADAAFISEAARLCRLHGILLIIDEVQTGFGRTGTLFACERYDVSPDILCLAKGIAAGFPMGAILVRGGLSFPPGSHGSTFGGNPLACAVANAVLDVVTADGFLPRVRASAETFTKRLGPPLRGLGLMIGLQLKDRARPYIQRLAEKGVLALSAGPKVLRLLPPLIITDGELDEVAAAVNDVLASA